jgi:predicted membrane GTPase involved in stress response
MNYSRRFLMLDIVPIVNLLLLVGIITYLLSSTSGTEVVRHFDHSAQVNSEMIEANRDGVLRVSEDVKTLLVEFNKLQSRLIVLYEKLLHAIDDSAISSQVKGGDGAL